MKTLRLHHFTRLIIGLTLLAGGAFADTVAYSSRPAFGGNDFLDWLVLGPEAPYGDNNLPPNPSSTLSFGGLGVTISMPGTQSFARFDEGGNTWRSGHFSEGAHLMFTNVTPGPITLTFGSLIFGIGLRTQANMGGFVATLDAFDADGNLVGSYSAPGIGGDCRVEGVVCDNAPFLGLMSSSANIARVVLSHANPLGADGFAIDGLSLQTSVPEPGTIALLGSGLLLGIGLARFRFRR